jgi:aspartyl-tRNA(Asn)/glutamyl-tRNA(Gln) amidotransferase subunit A
MTIETFGRRLRAGEVTCEEATARCLARIDAQNARLNAFVCVMADEARTQAREADQALRQGRDLGPLHGVPMAIKDLLDVRGTPTTAASRVRDGHVAAADCPAVARLRAAGAVLIGKTNLHEFAFGTTSEDSAFGAARNPLDPTRSPGGSSGGSAAAVAAGMALASVGTDTGGSIRIPAAACGTVGLKPGFGEVPTDGVVPLSRRLDHIGPLARSVADAWLVHRALAGRQAHRPEPAAPASMRLAVLRPYFCELLDDSVRARFDAALDGMAAAAVGLREASIPHARAIAPVYVLLVLADAAAYHGPALDAMPERYTPPVRLRLEAGRYLLAEDYVRALNGQEQLGRDVDAALAGHDALVLPTLPIPAPPLGAKSVRIGEGEQPVRDVMLRLTQLFSLTGHPAITIPCGRTTEGLPCGLQLVGARGLTDRLVSTALACETILRSLPTNEPHEEAE